MDVENNNTVPKPTDLPNPAADKAAEANKEAEVEVESKEKTLTQSQVDSIVAMEKTKAYKTAKKEAAAELEEATKLATMSEKESWEHKIAAAETKATEATAQAQAIEVSYEVQLAGLKAGVPAEQVDAVTKLAELGEVRGEDGKLDVAAVAAAVEAVVTKYPGLVNKGEQEVPPAGAGPSKTDVQAKQAESLDDAVASWLAKS